MGTRVRCEESEILPDAVDGERTVAGDLEAVSVDVEVPNGLGGTAVIHWKRVGMQGRLRDERNAVWAGSGFHFFPNL
jgi:hypothetical protein